MRKKAFVALILCLAASPVLAAQQGVENPATSAVLDPSLLTNAEIATLNAGRDSRDPAFIRCRRLDIPGSLVKKQRVCRTNADWARSWQRGNDGARDTYDALNRGSSNSVEPPGDIIPTGPRPQ